MTAIELINLALLKIGHSQGVVSMSDATREAYTAGLIYDHHLRATLRQFCWPFATAYAPLAQVRGPLWDDDPTVQTTVQAWSATDTYAVGDVVRVSSVNYYCILAHTNQTPPNATYWSTDSADAPDYANGDWTYGYRYPSDCIFARRLVNDGVGRAFSRTPIEFRTGRDVNGLLIYTAQPEAVLEYTQLDCDALWADDCFLDALTWRLASVLAPSLSRNKLTAAECWQMYLLTIENAAVLASREGQQHKAGEAEWIEAYGSYGSTSGLSNAA